MVFSLLNIKSNNKYSQSIIIYSFLSLIFCFSNLRITFCFGIYYNAFGVKSLNPTEIRQMVLCSYFCKNFFNIKLCIQMMDIIFLTSNRRPSIGLQRNEKISHPELGISWSLNQNVNSYTEKGRCFLTP